MKWAFPTEGMIWWSSPAIGKDGTIYVGSSDFRLYAINPEGGLKWSLQSDGTVLSSPAIGKNGTLYIGSDDRNLYAINPEGTMKHGPGRVRQQSSRTTVDRVQVAVIRAYVDGTIFTNGG